MNRWILVLLVLAGLGACSAKKHVAAPPVFIPGQPITITKTEIIYRDTVLYYPGDSAQLTALIKCDSLNRAYLHMINNIPGNQTRIFYRIYADTLKINARIDSAAIFHRYAQRYNTTTTTTETTMYVPPVIEKENPLREFMHWLLIMLGLAVIYNMLLMFRRPKSES